MTTTDSAPLNLSSEPVADANADAHANTRADSQNKPTLLMMGVNAFCNIRYKSMIFLFILFILITSDVFANILLKKINGTIDDRGIPTPYGTMIQGLILVLGYMVLNFFIEKELV